MPFYNCHIHVFNSKCAPEDFLEVALEGTMLQASADGIKRFVETRFGRWMMGKLSESKSDSFKTINRYATFMSVGTNATQQMIFENILKYYPNGSRFVILTLNMDHMGGGDSELKFQGQIDQVVQLRKLYPDACLPFLSIDPRMGTSQQIAAFLGKYIGKVIINGIDVHKPFIGIKFYPALGYFPYDKRLVPVYAFAQANNLPIMTHCTPSGAFFIGELKSHMGTPEKIDFAGEPPFPDVKFVGKHNNEKTDVFLKPENWKTVLANYPRLKVCFAHMGGQSKIWGNTNGNTPMADGWFNDLFYLMAEYENIYIDVSYTLFDKPAMDSKKNWTPKNARTFELIAAILKGNHPNITIPAWAFNSQKTQRFANTIKNRILFGTDYYMTLQEDSEENLAADLPNWLLDKQMRAEHTLLTESNPVSYLNSGVLKL